MRSMGGRVGKVGDFDSQSMTECRKDRNGEIQEWKEMGTRREESEGSPSLHAVRTDLYTLQCTSSSGRLCIVT
jgi:hypothetical protein